MRKNVFEVENAKNLSPEELANTFVITQDFTRLLTRKHHVVLGARGSGKTALLRMLSHDLLSRIADKRIKSIVRKNEFIGIFVPTKLEWVGSLKNKPWKDEAQEELFFQWRLNVSSCQSLFGTFESCLKSNYPRKSLAIEVEANLSSRLGFMFFGDSSIQSLVKLKERTKEVESHMHLELARLRTNVEHRLVLPEIGICFGKDLFVPLKDAIDVAEEVFSFRNTTWLLCIDETEFLTELHHRILNSHMRAEADKIFIKISTMPYCHYSLDTNTEAPLNEGHDFEYLYVDTDPVTDKLNFLHELFSKRTSYYRALADRSLTEILGKSAILDEDVEFYPLESPGFFKLLEEHASVETIQRAKELRKNPKEFGDQISRKMRGALILKDAVARLQGRAELDVYSGEKMALRCGDGNPRRIVRILNRLIKELEKAGGDIGPKGNVPMLDRKSQTRVYLEVSKTTLARVKSEPKIGPELYDLLVGFGNAFNVLFHQRKISTDIASSIEINNLIPNDKWILIQRAVGLGLLFPNMSASNPDHLPVREGTFRLAYVLAPEFKLLPRRGSSKKWNQFIGVGEVLGSELQQELEL